MDSSSLIVTWLLSKSSPFKLDHPKRVTLMRVATQVGTASWTRNKMLIVLVLFTIVFRELLFLFAAVNVPRLSAVCWTENARASHSANSLCPYLLDHSSVPD